MRVKIKRCGLFALSLLVSSIGLSVLLSNSLYATSIYDNVYQTTDDLNVYYEKGYSSSLPDLEGRKVDFKTSYYDYISKPENYKWNSYKKEYLDSFKTALEKGSWFVSMQTSKSNGKVSRLFQLFWRADGDFKLSWRNNMLTVNATHNITISYSSNWPDKPFTPYVIARDINTDSIVSSSDGAYANVFLTQRSGNITYPEGYDGKRIIADIKDRKQIRPQFTYQLHDRSLTAHDYAQDLPTFEPEPGYNIVSYEVQWSLFKCDDKGYDSKLNICNGSPVQVGYSIVPQDQDFTTFVDEYGDYFLAAKYQVQQCYRYPSYPATPDHCFYVDLGVKFKDYDFTKTEIHLVIDGHSETGDTSQLRCGIDGKCKNPEITCDNQLFIEKLSCEVNKRAKFGLFNPMLQSFISLFKSLTVPVTPSCRLSINDITIFNKNFPISQYSLWVCQQSLLFRQKFPIISTAVNFMLAMTALYGFFRIYNGWLNDRDNDLIKGVK